MEKTKSGYLNGRMIVEEIKKQGEYAGLGYTKMEAIKVIVYDGCVCADPYDKEIVQNLCHQYNEIPKYGYKRRKTFYITEELYEKSVIYKPEKENV